MVSPMRPAGSPLKSFFFAMALRPFHIESGLAAVEEERCGCDDVSRHGDARRCPPPSVLGLGQGKGGPPEKALDAARPELRPGNRRALERVAEGRREVDAAVEVARLVEMGECKLEGKRQA